MPDADGPKQHVVKSDRDPAPLVQNRTRAVEHSTLASSSFLEKFVLLFFGFAFAAALFGGLSYYEQEVVEQRLHARAVDNRDVDRNRNRLVRYHDFVVHMRRDIFTSVTKEVGRNLQVISALTWSYDDKLGPNDIASRLNQYRKARAEWVADEVRLRALIETYFGSELRDEFEFGIAHELEALGIDVERVYTESLRRAQAGDAPIPGTTGLALRARYNDLEQRVYTYFLNMLQAINVLYADRTAIPPNLELGTEAVEAGTEAINQNVLQNTQQIE